jgi:uncharacterized protein (TIGR03435 family)
MRLGHCLVIVPVLFCRCLYSQATAEFEAASVKWNPDSIGLVLPIMKGGPGTSSPGRIHYSGTSLMQLLTKAYRVYPDQVLGPGWLIYEKYAIDATFPPGTSEAAFESMLRSLLVQRFSLALHWEEKEFTVYELAVAKSGPKLKASTLKPSADGASAGVSDDEGVALPGPPSKLDSDGCPVLPPGAHGAVGSVGSGHCMAFRQYSLQDLIKALEMMVAIDSGSYYGPQASGAHIVDQTGLKGAYDFNLNFDFASRVRGSRVNSTFTDGASDPAGGPSLIRAIESQLGLKLDKTKSRLPVLVIDQATKKPASN